MYLELEISSTWLIKYPFAALPNTHPNPCTIWSRLTVKSSRTPYQFPQSHEKITFGNCKSLVFRVIMLAAPFVFHTLVRGGKVLKVS